MGEVVVTQSAEWSLLMLEVHRLNLIMGIMFTVNR